MSKKHRSSQSNPIVYSTDPSFNSGNLQEPGGETPEPSQQKLKVLLDRKQRAGKSVTLVTGFVGKADDLEALGKQLKTHCGTGGSVKDYEIIIQGDQRDKVVDWLMKKGYGSVRKG